MSSHAETLRAYALQIEHDIALYNVTGNYTQAVVLPEVPANLRSAAERIDYLEIVIDNLMKIRRGDGGTLKINTETGYPL